MSYKPQVNNEKQGEPCMLTLFVLFKLRGLPDCKH